MPDDDLDSTIGVIASTRPAAASAPEPVAPLAAADPVAASEAAEIAANQAIAEALATRALDPVAAQQLMIEQVVAEQRAALSPDALATVHERIAAVLDGDPALTELLR